jgi:uncharacterized protein YpuA (DUF1002 family)
MNLLYRLDKVWYTIHVGRVPTGGWIFHQERGIIRMRKKWKKGLAVLLSAVTALGAFCTTAMADAVMDKPYVSLGADLNAGERATVLDLLGVTEEQLQEYTVVTITNAEEHEYLDSYLDSSVIGTRALSSALVTGREDGHGIQVTTQNIGYCTVGMYQNALATAGMKNADVVVAGPTRISGTAALIGVMKAYSEMSGEPLQADSVEAATQELVATSQIGDELGNTEQAENLIAAVKEAIVADSVTDPDKIEGIIEDAAGKLQITLTEEQKQMIRDLMEKIGNLDLNVEDLKSQVQGIYDKLDEMGIHITQEDVQGFFAQISQWFSSIWNKITSWFSSFFN